MCCREDRLIRLPEVIHLCGISRSTLNRLIKSGDFPAPVPNWSSRGGLAGERHPALAGKPPCGGHVPAYDPVVVVTPGDEKGGRTEATTP